MDFQLGSSIFSHLERYRLEEILSATNNYSDENLITKDALGKVYKGELMQDGNLKNFIVRRLDYTYGEGDELEKEISMLRNLHNRHISSVLGYCTENNEKILIYEQAFHGTLDQHLSDPALTPSQRLEICLGVAQAINYIHYDVIHCDINSSKVFLDEDWEPTIYGFELSTQYPESRRHHLLFSRHFDTKNLTPKYDVYLFGVLLFEVLCGRKPMITTDGLTEELDELIDPNLRKQMDTQWLEFLGRVAYKCLNQQLVQRPTMDEIVKELVYLLEYQWKHANYFVSEEHSKAAEEGTSSNIWKMDCLKIPLRNIKLATENFDEKYFIGSEGSSKVYKAQLYFLNIPCLSSLDGKSEDELPKMRKTVAIKRMMPRADTQSLEVFLTEIKLLATCNHPNIISLVGFSREENEEIIVYEFPSRGDLSDCLNNNRVNLSWEQRLQICLDTAHGINYLHTNMEGKPSIIHRDIKSGNILLDENLNAKITAFGLSRSHPTKQLASTMFTKNIAGTMVYTDPEYLTTGSYKRQSDIYSFGVVLFEVLSGRSAYDMIYVNKDHMGLAPIARQRFNDGTIKELIDPKLTEENYDDVLTSNKGLNQDSFNAFSNIAYQCLEETQARRPTMEVVIKELQNALNLQVSLF